MNDFERELSQQPFRQPPADLRAAIFGETDNVITPPSWTWRDWFWPSPSAWAALAAVWLMFAALTGFEPGETPLLTIRSEFPPAHSPSPVFAFHHPSQFSDVLELSN